jgi:hypothetical protein
MIGMLGRQGPAFAAFALAAGVATGAAADASTAAPARPRGRVHLGLRTGYGVPIGKYADTRTLAGFRDTDVHTIGDDTYGVIPLWFDAGYRLTPELMLGAYFMFGVVLPRTAPATDPLAGGCPEGLDCFASGIRLGLEAQWRFAPGSDIHPWLGVGAGYERVNSHLEGELFSIPFDASTTHVGPDLLQLQAGVDFDQGPIFGLGPFVSLSAMQYTGCSFETAGASAACELDDRAWHGWLLLGVRGTAEL